MWDAHQNTVLHNREYKKNYDAEFHSVVDELLNKQFQDVSTVCTTIGEKIHNRYSPIFRARLKFESTMFLVWAKLNII